MLTPDISAETLALLQDRAKSQGVTVEALLNRWLSDTPRDSALPFKNYLAAVPTEIIICDARQPDFPIVYVNPAFEVVSGYRLEEVVGKNPRFLQGDDRDQPEIAIIANTLRQQGACMVTLRNYRKDGSLFWNRLMIFPLRNANNEITHFIGVQSDVTAVKRTEDALLQSEARLRSILESQTAMVIRTDMQGYYTYCNTSWLKTFNWMESDFIGLHSFDTILPVDHAKTSAAVAECLRTPGKPVQVTLRKPRQDGGVMWSLWEFVVIQDATGTPTEIQCIGFDITKEKETEEALRESEARYKLLTELISDYAQSIRVELDGTLVCEWTVGNFLPMAYQPISGQRIPVDYVHPDDLPRLLADLDRTLQNHATTTEYRTQKKDGGYMWVRFFRKPVWDEQEGRVVRIYSVGQDVNDFKEAEERLQVQMRALETAANAIVITDRHARIEWVNPAFTDLTGYTFEEARGKNPNALVKSGFHDEDFYRNLWETILSGQIWFGKMVNRRKNGTLYSEEQTITPVCNTFGEITHFIAIKQDITAREQSAQLALEQERLTAILKKEKEYNAAVQNAIASLSHDLKTPLSVIEMSRHMLSEYFDRLDAERRREKLETIGKQLHYVTELLNDLTLVTGTSLNHRVAQVKEVNLEALCHITVQEIQDSTGSKHRLFFESDGQISNVLADEVLISRILLNLLSNAVKYSAPGSEIRLKLARTNDHIIMKVIDRGMGIAESDLPHIFDPFFRVSGVQHIGGTGLGLSIVYDCVKRHGGTIGVQSTLGEGSVFTVEIPLLNNS